MIVKKMRTIKALPEYLNLLADPTRWGFCGFDGNSIVFEQYYCGNTDTLYMPAKWLWDPEQVKKDITEQKERERLAREEIVKKADLENLNRRHNAYLKLKEEIHECECSANCQCHVK